MSDLFLNTVPVIRCDRHISNRPT